MKIFTPILSVCLCCSFLTANGEPTEDLRAKHKDGSALLADEQDELSADVQQLVIEQTMPQVIKLLGEVEDIMDETTDRLAETDTGGETIAAQTEIIEKIHAAAKERQSQGGAGESGSAMMDMMERMMGKQPGEQSNGKNGEKKDGQGGGSTGESETGNEAADGAAGGSGEVRRVPKAGGAAGQDIPGEFQKAFDAYNRGLEKKLK